MTTANLSSLISAFFVTHLAAERNVSPHTTLAYRDGLKLLLRFAADFHGRPVSRLRLEELTPSVLLAFLTHLESARRNSCRTRNARLAGIHSFFRYVLSCEPAYASLCQRVLAIPLKKTMRRVLGYFSAEEMAHLLAQVDRSTSEGERDYVLMALLYDTGARIQEILDLKPRDFRLTSPMFVQVTGKGRKQRLCPLLPQTSRLVAGFLAGQHPPLEVDRPLFRNRGGQPLTRHGANYLFNKYLAFARKTMPQLKRLDVSLHTIRHTKAIHLLQSGVPLISIKDILGHAHLKSTEVYVYTDLEMKRKALELSGSPSEPLSPRAEISPDILSWLESL